MPVVCFFCKFQLPRQDQFNCECLRQFKVYTGEADESALQLVESGELANQALLHDIDAYSNLTIGVSIVNSAELESVIERTVFVGSKYTNSISRYC